MMRNENYFKSFLFIVFNSIFIFIFYITFMLYLSRLKFFSTTYEPDPIGFIFFIPATPILFLVAVIIQSTSDYLESDKIVKLIYAIIPTLFLPPFLIDFFESLTWHETSDFLGWYGVLLSLSIASYYVYLIIKSIQKYLNNYKN